MARKFIISQTGVLRFGNVSMHRDLLEIGEDECYGGGFWTIDHRRQAILLHGRSFDFGGPDFTRLREVDWSFFGNRSMPLLYAPYYPNEDTVEMVFSEQGTVNS